MPCPDAHKMVHASLLHATCKACGETVDVAESLQRWLQEGVSWTGSYEFREGYKTALDDVLDYCANLQRTWAT